MANPQRQIAVNFGVIYGVAAVTLAVIQYATGDFQLGSGQSFNFWSLINILLTVGLPVYALIKIRQANDGYLTFGQGFRHSFTVVIIGSLFTVVWILVYTYVLNTNYQEELMNQQYQAFMESGVSESMAESQMEMSKRFMTPGFMALFGFLGGALLGVILSLILGAIFQKKPPQQV